MASNEVLHCNDSKSLWNYTLSPGWTEKEVEVFRAALMKYGMGSWTQIVESRCLPGKTVAQLNNQMQRMIGQQSTGEFMKCHIDPADIFAHNKPRPGRRKNGCLVNTGDNRTKEWYKKKRQENKKKRGLTTEQIAAIVIPTLKKEDMSNVMIKTVTGGFGRQNKYDRIKSLEERIKTLELERSKRMNKKEGTIEKMEIEDENFEEKKEKKEKKVKKPGRKSTGRRKRQKKKEKTQEEIDMEYARQLQEQFDMEQ